MSKQNGRMLNSSTPRPPAETDTGPLGFPPQTSSETSRPLNVTDALSYLDAVKVQFQDRPDVYNHFLDIMKDFKSEVIDTPGVIERVSILFHGIPYLIQGFNTFLPPGYRIEISQDARDMNLITVTTPMGTTTSAHGYASGHPQLLGAPNSRSITPYQHSQVDPRFEMSSAPAYQGSSTTAAASVLRNLSNKNQVENQQPGREFNHAIQYLNKIKARYTDDQETYKQFLEILQTYQKEQKHLNDSQVYVRVRMLFKDAPDLLHEFKDFLPEATHMSNSMGMVGYMPPITGPGVAAPWSLPDMSSVGAQDKAIKKSVPNAKKRRRAPERGTTPVGNMKAPSARSKKAKIGNAAEPNSPRFSPYPPAISPIPLSQPHAHSTPDELLFFERAKKALGSRETYDEFLKLLDLYSNGIIDAKTLVDMGRVFLGDGDLLMQFKEIVGVDPRQSTIELGPPGSIRSGPPEALSSLPAEDGEGPSYRRLPNSEINLACSGRDHLCRSVLNNEWVSHPTWASEEAGFVAHKKNSFEEALHKSEEERHEFHVHIEALARTIAVLAPIATRIENMSDEERSAFRLKPDLGGSSKSIYDRVIKKIYDREAGHEVIQALQDCPGVAVPVVVARLKQKDDEWRRAQRDWSRTWRDVDAKNFYKSLDYQSITFKANEKKSITVKHLVGNVESIKADQVRKTRPHFACGSEPQLEFSLEETSVLHDSLKLVYSFLERSQTQYSPSERRAIESWLQTDLLKQLLKTDSYDNNAGSHVSSRACSPDNSMVAVKTTQPADDIWIHESSAPPSEKPAEDSSRILFYGNTTFYTMLCLLQLLYSRLLACRNAGALHVSEKHASIQANPVSVELGLDDPNGPSAVLSQALEALGNGRHDETNITYLYLLDACEKLFDNELDQGLFEEHMRWFFGNKAYYLFTLDKLITALVKQIHTVLSDNRCQEIWTLFQQSREMPILTNRDVIRYRREAEQHVGPDEHLYRVLWKRGSMTMYLQLVDPDDPSVDGDGSVMNRWREYVDSFVLRQPTEWMPVPKKTRGGSVLFLRRSRHVMADETPPSGFKSLNDMRIRISLGTYKMFYEVGCEDVFVRGWREDEELRERADIRHEERQKSCWVQE